MNERSEREVKLDVREQLGRLETEEKMALAHRDYARATEIANRRIRLERHAGRMRVPSVRKASPGEGRVAS